LSRGGSIPEPIVEEMSEFRAMPATYGMISKLSRNASETDKELTLESRQDNLLAYLVYIKV